MIIDAHTHLFAPEVIERREDYFDDLNFYELYGAPGAGMVSHGGLLDAMKSSGIDRSVVMGFPWQKRERAEKQNLYFREISRETDGALIPFGTVVLEGERSLQEQVRTIRELGLYGVGEAAFYTDSGDALYDTVGMMLDAGSRYSLPVCLHLNEPVGHGYAGKYAVDFGRLYRLFLQYPAVDIILAHWGGGILFYELMPEVQKAFERVYYDTAASPYLYRDDVYKVAAGIVGSKKILFGTDYPLLGPQRYLKGIADSSLTAEEREDILGGNAERLFRL